MKYAVFFALFMGSAFLFADGGAVYEHSKIEKYSMFGNTLSGLATKSMGAKEFEIWRSSIAVGSRVPPHVHETEEVFVLLKGKLLAVVGGEKIECEAPCTLICPANVPHELINIGDEPTDQILVLGIDSKIRKASGEEMDLPWRK